MGLIGWMILGAVALMEPPSAARPKPKADNPEPAALEPPSALSSAEANRREALTRYGHAVWLARNDRPATAWKQLLVAARQAPDQPAILKERFYLERRFGRPAAALLTAREAYRLDPRDLAWARDYITLLHELRQFREGLKVTQELLALPNVTPRAQLGLLMDGLQLARAAKDPAVGLTLVQQALTVLQNHEATRVQGYYTDDAELLQARYSLAVDQLTWGIQQENWPTARAALTQARALAERPPLSELSAVLQVRLWDLESRLADGQGQGEAALRALQQFLSAANPPQCEPYERLARLIRQVRQPQAVLPALREYAEGTPPRPKARWVYLYERAINDPNTLESFQQACFLSPDPDAIEYLLKAYQATERITDLLNLLDQSPSFLPRMDLFGSSSHDVVQRRRIFEGIKSSRALQQLILREAFTPALPQRREEVRDLVCWIAEQRQDYRRLEDFWYPLAVAGGATAEQKYLQVLRIQKKWDQLLLFCTQQITRRTTNTILWTIRRAEALAELGRVEEALQSIENLEGTLPVLARLQKAQLLAQLGRPEKANAVLVEVFALPLNPQDRREAYLTLANVQGQLKNYEQMDAAYETILEATPDDVLTLNNFAYNLAEQNRRLPEAEVYIRRAIELEQIEQAMQRNGESASGTYLDSLGWILFRRGKVTEAKQVFEQALKTPTGISDGTVWDHYGDVLFRLGEKEAARAAWTRAAKLFEQSLQGRQDDRHAEILWKLKQ